MTESIVPVILGKGVMGPQREISLPLDELIFNAVSLALADAKLTIDDVDAVTLAASDILDGRGISTMTLSGSAGSFRKTEMRVCDDGLAALHLARCQLISGSAQRVVVAAWSKLSDTIFGELGPLALDPTFLRPLGFSEDVLAGLQDSSSGVRDLYQTNNAGDCAVAVVVGTTSNSRSWSSAILGTGSSLAAYAAGTWSSETTALACRRAFKASSFTGAEVGTLLIASPRVRSASKLASELGIAFEKVSLAEMIDMELGYAAGLLGVSEALVSQSPGPHLVVSAAGLNGQSTYAVLLGRPNV